jgi:2-polyprenyl-3-methyl-5-hydroxy-6-metoxy-1,4-benzoquinol methylase
MICRVCNENELQPLWSDCAPDPERGNWWRCLACGSDSSDSDYNTLPYDGDYRQHIVRMTGSIENAVAALQSNVDLFELHSGGCPDRTFLDVGCLEGAAMMGMAAKGWSVHGFDVMAEAQVGSHVTIAPKFRASLFPRRYSAILAREVIEHVPDWRALFSEIHATLLVKGLFQLQTPRPWLRPDKIPYQKWHLQIFAPQVIRYWLERFGLEVLECKLWDMGQCWLTRRLV